MWKLSLGEMTSEEGNRLEINEKYLGNRKIHLLFWANLRTTLYYQSIPQSTVCLHIHSPNKPTTTEAFFIVKQNAIYFGSDELVLPDSSFLCRVQICLSGT